jgi:phenylacetate-CoA ligase
VESVYTLEERLYLKSPVFVQNALVSYRGRKLLRERFGPEYERWDRFLGESERFDAARLRDYQNERLGVIVSHAYETVPYYRRLMDGLKLSPSDLTRVEDLPKLPVLTKDVIRANLTDMISSAVDRRRIRKIFTSGTTGDAVNFYWDRTVDVVNNACLWRARRWAGFEFGEPYATLLGKLIMAPERKSPPFWRFNRGWNQMLMSSHHLTLDNLPHYIGALRDAGVVALDTYPSMAAVLARYLESTGDYLPLKCVFTTAEPLHEPDRRIISERFRCGVFDGYSQAERVVYSAECDHHRGHHLFEEHGICEFVDGDGNPVEAGTPGRLVGTGLHNMAMPLLRYDVGDVASLSTEACTCGRGLPLMGLVATRQGDIISTPDGRLLPPLMILRPFMYVEGIKASQFVQHTLTDYTARIATDRELTNEETDELVRNLCVRLGRTVNIKVEQMDDIPRSANQKFRRVISEVPLTWDGAASTEALRAAGPGAPADDGGGAGRAEGEDA